MNPGVLVRQHALADGAGVQLNRSERHPELRHL